MRERLLNKDEEKILAGKSDEVCKAYVEFRGTVCAYVREYAFGHNRFGQYGHADNEKRANDIRKNIIGGLEYDFEKLIKTGLSSKEAINLFSSSALREHVEKTINVVAVLQPKAKKCDSKSMWALIDEAFTYAQGNAPITQVAPIRDGKTKPIVGEGRVGHNNFAEAQP
jgi:hypothetical protein